jgi:branched-chain amino acid transport system ATP-binding protein
MLKLQGLSIGYGGGPVVHDITLSVGAGEIVTLIGANGAGKSTIAKAISGLLPLSAGSIHFDGRRIDTTSARSRVRAGLVHVPEGRQIFPNLSVAENLQLGAYTHRRDRSAADVAVRIQGVCTRFPALLERLDSSAGYLSGGQQQMLAIARGLMAEPRLIVLDEPSLGLSPALVTEIFSMINSLREQGLSVLLSEQNARLSLAVADRAYVIEMGRIVLAGEGKDLLGHPEVTARYLGGRHDGQNTAVESQSEAFVARLRHVLQL